MSNIFEDTIKEVNAVVKDTEKCANDIFDAAESIVKNLQKIDDSKLRKRISDNITRIFEACHFQDFAGQRATKIIANLKEVESQTGPIQKKKLSKSKALKQGPQLETASQADIDKMFEEA